MKGISTLLIVFGCLAIAAQATYLRVIHAVPPGDMAMDVYYTALQTGEKIRLFQNLNYTDIPPYFFIPVLQNREQVTLSFLLRPSQNVSESLVSQQDLQGLPSHTVSLGKNLTYTLVVTSSSQGLGNQSQDQGLESQGNQQGQNMNLQYLLLNDYSRGEESTQGLKYIRLINLAEDASSISLIEANGECPQENMNNTQSQGSQDQGSQDEGSQDQNMGSQGQSGSEMNEPLAQQLAFLESTDYIELPQSSQPTNLFVCYQGQKIAVTPAPLYRASGSRFSILLFTGSQNQGSQNQSSQDQGSQDLGFQDQGSQQGSQQENQQSQFIAYVVSDEPVTIQNVRIRIVHAESSLPAVNVLLDGQPIFNQVSFGNVTDYYITVRGIHSLSVLGQGSQNQVQQGSQDQGSQQGSQDQGSQGGNQRQASVQIVTFFAWTKSYSIAIVRTSSGNIGLESSQNQSEQQGGEEQSGNQGQQGNQMQDLTAFQPTQGSSFPGFQGPLHKIFLDDFSQNATLGKNYAYLQVVHLIPNAGAVDVKIGDENISNLRFLQSSLYRSVLATSQNIPLRVTLSSSGAVLLSETAPLQPGTLYTLWLLQDSDSQPNIILTTDRSVQIQCMVLDNEMMSGQQGLQGSQGNQGMSGSQ